MKLLVLGVLFAAASLSSARTLREMQRGHFVGDGSNDVAVTILQSLNEKKQNAVFSPLGYNTILAVLTEGARGNTRNQLVSSLKLPEDTYAVRSTYKRVLSEMTEREVLNKPQFQNWFYVYKNYTVEESYKNILKDNYLIEIKEVDRYNDDFEEEDASTSIKPIEGEGSTESQAAVSNLADASQSKDSSEEEKDSKDEKDSKEDNASKEDKNSKEDNDSKEDKDSKENESKEDESKESEKPKNSKKPTNVMKIKEKDELKKEKLAYDGVMTLGSETPASAEDSKKEPEGSRPEEESVTTIRIDDGTTQPPTELKASDVPQPTIDVRRSARDTASALSVNKLSTTLKSDEERVAQNMRRLSRMMAFNALYFKGNWSTKFSLSPEKKPFHVTPQEEKQVEVLHAEDEFESGKVEELDAWALDIPYQGERYSLLVLVPASDDGLDGLLKRLPGFSFYNIDKQLTKLRMNVCIPKLKFYSITKPKDSFIKSGITDLFNEEADLSGISGEKGLYLDELVQLVTFDFDETQASYNYLTTTDVSDLRSNSVPFSADQPFIFMLRDKVENLNIVSGIIYDPTQPQEL